MVLGVGDGYLGPAVRAEVIRRNKARQNKEKTKVSKKKSDLLKLTAEVNKIRHQQALDRIFFDKQEPRKAYCVEAAEGQPAVAIEEEGGLLGSMERDQGPGVAQHQPEQLR